MSPPFFVKNLGAESQFQPFLSGSMVRETGNHRAGNASHASILIIEGLLVNKIGMMLPDSLPNAIEPSPVRSFAADRKLFKTSLIFPLFP
jgi:hypothetical protein